MKLAELYLAAVLAAAPAWAGDAAAPLGGPDESVAGTPSAPAAHGDDGRPSKETAGPLPFFLPGQYEVSQSNWSGGDGVKGPVTSFGKKYFAGARITAGENGYFWLAGEDTKFRERYPLNIPGWEGLMPAMDVAPIDDNDSPDVAASWIVTTPTPTFGLTYWKNLGGQVPAFGAAKDLESSNSESYYPLAVKAADITADGLTDIAYLGRGNLAIFSQKSGERWEDKLVDVGGTHKNANTGAVEVAFVDGDRNADLLVSIAAGNYSKLYCYTRPGAEFVKNDVELGRSYYDVAAADFDGDGDDDFVATGALATVFFETTASTPAFRKAQGFLGGGFKTEVGDFDGDGKPDVVVAGETRDEVSCVAVYLNRSGGNGPIQFERHQVVPDGPPKGSTLVGVAVSDLNGDKKDDMAVCGVGPNALFVWYNDGPVPSGSAWEEIGAGTLVERVAAADLDGDGFTDLVTGNRFGGFNWFKFSGGVVADGYVVSSILDTGGADTAYEIVDWNVDLRGGKLEVKARTSDSNEMTGAFGWDNCDPLAKGKKPERTNGVFDGDRYVQYRVKLINVSGESPQFKKIALGLTAGDENGPEVSGISVWPDPVEGAQEVLFQAQVSDVNFGGSLVTAAEYTVDAKPGPGGSGTPLEPTDGKWDSPLEAVRASVSPAGWGEAQTHVVYVRGRDARGNWGAYKAYGFDMGDVSFFPEDKCFAYPNPVTGSELQVRYFVTKEAEVKLEVFDVRGRRVAEAEGRADGYTHSYLAVDVSGLAPDVYIYRATATALATGEREVVGKKFAVLK